MSLALIEFQNLRVARSVIEADQETAVGVPVILHR
jgi:hypothetical protein